jgi:GR25 family glycosyltransferase involved in LPS biosynthesis
MSYKHALNNIFYINLKHREDRNFHLLKEFEKINIIPTRFEAIQNKIGAIGCTESHIIILKLALEKEWDYITIVEDDFTFLDHNTFKKSLESFLTTQKEWDVLILAGNNFPPYQHITENYIQIKNCQTTTGYIVSKKYISTLIKNFEDGLRILKNTKNISEYSLDIYWKKLQERDKWFMLTPVNAYQYDNFSDIIKRNSVYSKEMLKLK